MYEQALLSVSNNFKFSIPKAAWIVRPVYLE